MKSIYLHNSKFIFTIQLSFARFKFHWHNSSFICTIKVHVRLPRLARYLKDAQLEVSTYKTLIHILK